MNKFQLYRLLRKNTNLSYKRSPAFEQNKWAKLFILVNLFSCKEVIDRLP